MYSEDEDKLCEENLLERHDSIDGLNIKSLRLAWPWRRQVYLWILQLVFFLISLSFLLVAHSGYYCPRQDGYEDHMPMYSPALEGIKGTGHYHRFDGSFMTPNAFKGTPNPSIDENWDSITYADGGVISISEETLYAVNASAKYSVKLAPEIGGGYMASVEVLHQLHCLNMLRQATYEDYYKDKAEPWKDSPQTLRYHLDHCIDNLRQKLMCDADAGILTYVWAKGHPAPFPDFSVQHKCRDFSALKNWVIDHQIYATKEHGIERLPGSQELESPP
ncbi:uncharacterized protein F4822DRAFT_56151 [Hypoxylon trugodes]|uniref:uncharacterized protein n=1 Tax=Hypoxylon trugodes TaxID=326681 RepID=UPI00219E33A0|nr:uncharacterized protein F4822DRAFT_56151 [Hypoxylon trugodes]KAI1383943.1 hypothetical protein F4822DRAFT_56151 [Hypoxylon trugodes]